MKKPVQSPNPMVLGLYIGVLLGAVSMMVAGGMGNTTVADLSLIFGILAGPSIGWIIGRIQEKKASGRHDPKDNASE